MARVPSMLLSKGSRVGHYEIVAEIGRGGMGEVYRARDTRLNRDVALKLLPAAVSADPDRIARFRREAQLLAALNHPNIAHVYGIEEAGDTYGLIMELIDGIDLRQRLDRGPLTRVEAMSLAIEIASALEAAHDKGIIHRDLKPANIMLAGDGHAKVLDFGLAKSSHPASADDANSPTLTSPVNLTAEGAIVGTAAYMSPEQATGRVADRRSDIWSFGCVLYELLAGKPAFASDDVPSTLAAILTVDPDWTALERYPSSVQRLVRRCLVKDRRRRFADMSDVRLDLEDTANGQLVPANAPMPASVRSSRLPWALAALSASAVLALLTA
ncbi:MAG TPA: serine/threonine-protein kinase [Vicinamibacterales bacterium]